MQLMLDTHTLLWFYGGDESLPPDIRELIRDPTNTCYVSVASLWEISIKISSGKLIIGTPMTELFDFLERNQFWMMPIEFSHLLQLQ